jgi:hypothetical protein
MNIENQAAVKGAPEVTVEILLSIEGKTFPWERDTITTAEIIKLGGWDASQGVIEVDEDQSERTVAIDEIVRIQPGKEYGKRHRWKRGAA